MEKNMKAADLIGKTIVVGDNQGTIVIKSVQDNGMLACEFSKAGETTTTPITVTMPNLQKMTERGLWKLSLSPGPSPKSEGSEVTTEADVDEVEDIVPVVKPRAKSDGGSKTADAPQTSDIKPQTSNQPTAKVEPIVKPKQQPKAKNVPQKEQKGQKAEPTATGKYVYATYKTSKGKTGAKITGFASEDDVFYANAADIHASGSYERDKDGNKLYYLCFGPRYADAAKEVCKAMNDGKKFEDCKAIVDKATDDRIAQREEWKQRRSERAANAEPKDGYSKEDVAAMLRQVLAGGDVPEDIKKLLQAA